jgi:uncharacterized membrane protein
MNRLLFLALMSIIILSANADALEISTTILDKYHDLSPGEDVQFQMYIKSIESAGRMDIRLDYQIIHGEEVIASARELKAVETQASFIARIRVPEETPSGTYILRVTINDGESSTDTFSVKKQRDALDNIKYYILLLCVVVLAVGIVIWREVHKVHMSLQTRR